MARSEDWLALVDGLFESNYPTCSFGGPARKSLSDSLLNSWLRVDWYSLGFSRMKLLARGQSSRLRRMCEAGMTWELLLRNLLKLVSRRSEQGYSLRGLQSNPERARCLALCSLLKKPLRQGSSRGLQQGRGTSLMWYELMKIFLGSRLARYLLRFMQSEYFSVNNFILCTITTRYSSSSPEAFPSILWANHGPACSLGSFSSRLYLFMYAGRGWKSGRIWHRIWCNFGIKLDLSLTQHSVLISKLLRCVQVGLESFIDGERPFSQDCLDAPHIQGLFDQQFFCEAKQGKGYFLMWCSCLAIIALVRWVHSSMIFLISRSIVASTFSPQGLVYCMSGQAIQPNSVSMPSLVTSAKARLQAFSRSSYAPVVTSLKKCCSAHLPPRMKQIRSINSSFVCSWFSFRKYCAKPNAPLERGMMVTLRSGSAPSRNHETTACPLSWQATVRFSLMDTNPFRQTPPITLSEDSQKSIISTMSLAQRAARIAAQLHRLASSAPLKPGVRAAMRLAQSYLLYFGESFRGLK